MFNKENVRDARIEADEAAPEGYAGLEGYTAANAPTGAAGNPLRSLQWYLDGQTTAGSNPAGANIAAVSAQYSGHGVVIGLIDEGFDITNPDLAGRFDTNLSYNPTGRSAGIMPDSAAAVHGTWVAAVVGAAGDNGYGTVGVAPGATLAGFYAHFGSGGSSRAEIADLLARQVDVDISNNSWGYGAAFSDNFQTASWAPIKEALHLGVSEGRDGLGTVYVFAAGNDRQYVANSSTLDGDNTNSHSLTNSRFEITAAASTQDGHIASFSTPGASILVTAPGVSILTTSPDNGDGDRTNDFMFVDGTSFATPIVSGVVAMMLEANPGLGYRDVQEILAYSAHQIGPASASWAANGARDWNGGGHMVSNDFGFGLVDAHAAVRLAETWNGVHDAANETMISVAGNVGANTTLTDFHPNSYTATVSSDHQNFSIDWVEVDVSLLHSYIGDLKIHLVSPTGTDSVLVDRPAAGTNSSDNLNFTFSTDHDWGESPVGTWTLYVEDAGTGGTGSMVSYALRFYGDNASADTTYYYTDDFAALAGNRSTITDASGNDTINAAAVSGDLSINLTPGSASTIDGRSVVISAGTVVENVYGGDGNDTIVGNAADNDLFGGRGNDTLKGGAGQDHLHGGDGNDTLYGGDGADQFIIDGPNTGVDKLADFVSGQDQIVLDHAGFGVKAGSLSAAGVAFAIGNATSNAPTIVFNQTTGDILWDADGKGSAAATAFAHIDTDGLADGTVVTTDIGAHPAGWQPVGSGDFNNDGTSDVAWYNAATGNLDLWELSNGHWAQSVDVGSHPAGYKVAGIGDFNNDGTSDIAWYNATTGNLDIWKIVDGHWAGSVDLGSHPIGWQPAGVGDFNGDGTSDIAWYNATTGNLDIWKVKDSQWAGSVDVGSHPLGSQLAGIGDFNGDGTSDIAWFSAATGHVDIWQIVDGHWAASVDAGSHPGGAQLAGVGDFNGDGTSDILWSNPTNNGSDLWQIADGKWSNSIDLGSRSADWQLAGVGDFNNNGASDVMLHNSANDLNIWSLMAHHSLSANDFLFG